MSSDESGPRLHVHWRHPKALLRHLQPPGAPALLKSPCPKLTGKPTSAARRRSLGVARRILIIGGTSEARELASRLFKRGHDVTTSLAGATRSPTLPVGRVRMHGFGGADKLAEFLREQGIDLLLDASHPFAAQISRHAFDAAQACGLRYLRIERPPWTAGAADKWHRVADSSQGASAIPEGRRVMLTIGRKSLAHFFARPDLSGIVRTIEAPGSPLPPRWTLIRARPPFTVTNEMSLMRGENMEVLVTKNSGGSATDAKLAAARTLGLMVVMIERPAKPPATTAPDAASLIALIDR